MDAQWKAETDARLNALQSQLTSTRKLALGLAILAIALGGWATAATLRKPKKIVLEGSNGSLTLEPSQIQLKVGTHSVSVALDGLWIRDRGKTERTTNIGAGSARLSTTDGASLALNAFDDSGSVEVVNRTAGMAILRAGTKSSELRVSSLNSKNVTLEATPSSAQIAGIGTTFFGMGDNVVLPPSSSSAPPSDKPGCDPFGAMHGCTK